MARPLIPFVQNGYYASRNWIPLVKGNGFTTSGGGEQEEVWETASGSIVTFDAVAAPLRQLSVAVEPVQNLNGYDSPWPAGGGKNKLPPHYVGSIFSAGITYTYNADESITVQGDPTAKFIYCNIYGANSTNISILRPLLDGLTPGGPLTMTIDGNPSGIDLVCQFNKADGTLTTGRTTSSKNATTVPADAVYMFVGLRVQKSLVTPPINATVRVLVGNGSTVEDYSPYSNICPITGWDSVNIWVQPTHDTSATPTATIQLGETVYGGTLDVVNGKMTVDRAMVDLGTLAWSYTGTLFMTLAIPGIKPPPDGNTVPNCICEAYKAVAYIRLSTTDPSFTIIYEGSPNSGRLWLKDSTFTTLDSFKSFISGKHLCYELATPFELTLTPEQISTLQGTNNVWSDAGDVTVEYRAQ